MITLTYNDILNNNNFFKELCDIKMPAPAAIEVAKLINNLEEKNYEFETERQKLIKEYAKRNTNGDIIEENGEVVIQPAHRQDFINKLNQLRNTSITIDNEPLKVDILKTIEMTPRQALNFMVFI